MTDSFLFRGVSDAFNLANNGRLKPKAAGPFRYTFHWGEPGIKWDSGGTWGSSSTNAVIRHQLNQEGFPTSGISTTPHLSRAIFYTRGSSGKAGGFVFKIDRLALAQHGVSEFVVAQICAPSVPEDDEVILVLPGLEHLPPEVIVEVLTVPAMSP